MTGSPSVRTALLTLCGLFLAACLAACTTTNTQQAAQIGPASISSGARVVVLQPDIELSLLLATGLQEPKADWSKTAEENIAGEIERHLQARGHVFSLADPTDQTEGRLGQVLRLNEAVAASILQFNYGVLRLPTKRSAFDWTIGPGAQVVGDAFKADYAILVYGRGSYSSAGRAAMVVLGAIAGVAVPMGGQQFFVSVVDLKTGQVIWTNLVVAGPTGDVRDAEGAKTLMTSVLAKAPF